MNRREFVKFVLGGIGVATLTDIDFSITTDEDRSGVIEKPNIILIMADDLE